MDACGRLALHRDCTQNPNRTLCKVRKNKGGNNMKFSKLLLTTLCLLGALSAWRSISADYRLHRPDRRSRNEIFGLYSKS